VDKGINCIYILFIYNILYLINSLKSRHFGLVDYVYIDLVGCIAFLYITLEQKDKSNVKSIYFQKIRA